MKRTRLTVCIYGLLLTMAMGCGPRAPEMGQVNGKVMFNGAPLTTGTLAFVPEIGGLPIAYAQIKEDGTYIAATKMYGKGVPVGKHRVMITAIKVIPGQENNPDALTKMVLPVRYSSDQQSGLSADVSAGENKIDFSLTK